MSERLLEGVCFGHSLGVSPINLLAFYERLHIGGGDQPPHGHAIGRNGPNDAT